MRRFFVGGGALVDDKITITGSDARHMKNVLRLAPGDMIVAIDGSATEYEVKIETISPREVVGEVTSARPAPLPEVYLALFQGLPKGRKLDEVVEKATELGVDRV